jgi:hypothetical protein
MQARIRQTCLRAVLALGLVVALAGTALAQSNDSSIGTWKLNVARSKYTAGTVPKSATVETVAAGTGVKVTVDSVGADGAVSHWAYTANYDGKDSPITGNCGYGDTVSRTRVDANTYRSVYKKDGKVTTTQTTVVSADGKARTTTGTGTDAKGQAVNSMAVYDKQASSR